MFYRGMEWSTLLARGSSRDEHPWRREARNDILSGFNFKHASTSCTIAFPLLCPHSFIPSGW
jgi:hypothetical protein